MLVMVSISVLVTQVVCVANLEEVPLANPIVLPEVSTVTVLSPCTGGEPVANSVVADCEELVEQKVG